MKLSICIPTYNFGAYISDTLTSVLRQADSNTEVVVLDSNSDDNTPAVVRDLQRNHPCLRYIRANERGGIDRDMAKVVSLADGEYCWLLSADDTLREGALRRIHSILEDGVSDVLLCPHSNCTRDMQLIDQCYAILRDGRLETFRLHLPEDRSCFFGRALSTEAFFSFISGLVVRKSAWDKLNINEQFIGSCWAHVARFFELSKSELVVTHVPEVLIDRRGENDSFRSQGLVRRYALAIDGYRRLAEYFFGSNSYEAAQVRRVLRREFPLRCLLGAKAQCEANSLAGDLTLLEKLVEYLYEENTASNVAKRVTYSLCPSHVFTRARAVYRRLKRRNDALS